MCIRKEIPELIALYSLEPDLRDIYVEGTFDKYLIEWFLSEQNISGVLVYSIETIDVPDDVLTRQGLNGGGNRSRVIALSQALASDIPPNSHVICIADRDQEDYLSTVQQNACLTLTDYTSSDLYLFQKRTFQKLLPLVLGGFPLSVDDLISELTVVLKDVFLLHLSNTVLNWNMTWISFTKYMQIGDHFIFEKDKFIKAYLQKNNRWSQRVKFEEKQAELRAKLKDDPRCCIRGHDFIDLLHHAVKKLKHARAFGNSATLQGAFAGCLESQDICKEELFQRIAKL